MKGAACEHEPRVLAAWRAEGGSDEERRELAAHLESCPSCRRAAHLSAALGWLAAEDPGVELPDPRRIFWRAQVLERFADRRQAQQRAARPLNLVRWLAAAVGVAVAVVLAAQAVLGGGGGLATELAAELTRAAGPQAALVQATAWLGLGLLACATAFGVYTLVEEP